MCGIHRDQFNCKLPNSIQWITKQKGHHPRSSAQSDTYQPLRNLFPWIVHVVLRLPLFLCGFVRRGDRGMFPLSTTSRLLFFFLPRKILKEKKINRPSRDIFQSGYLTVSVFT